MARGRPLRTLYPASLVSSCSVADQVWLRNWADVGEQQRVLDDVPHQFTVFGDELVLSCTQWGEITDDLVAIRSPMLIRAFCAIFDAGWRAGLPVAHSIVRDGGNDRLLTMLAAGQKDEAIARYLGVSLRTVRRRVSLLMEEHGAHTRFQLGIAAERRGLLREPRAGNLCAARAGASAPAAPRAKAGARCRPSCSWVPSGATKARARPPTCSARRVDYVVKFNGGNNAGHTVVVGRREVRPAPAAVRHPHAGLHAGDRQRRRRRPGRAVPGDRRSRGPRRRHLPAGGQLRRARDRRVQPGARQGDRAVPRAPAGSARPGAASARPTPTR